MIPGPPPRETSMGFLYVPPFRIVGESIAGSRRACTSRSWILGLTPGRARVRCCRLSKHLAITHGHMDHIGRARVLRSQRRFQGMGTAKIGVDGGSRTTSTG